MGGACIVSKKGKDGWKFVVAVVFHIFGTRDGSDCICIWFGWLDGTSTEYLEIGMGTNSLQYWDVFYPMVWIKSNRNFDISQSDLLDRKQKIGRMKE